MFFDTALVDLDDTLYSYQDAHGVALNAALTDLANKSGRDMSALKQQYSSLSVALKVELGMTAASHNRYIYFKQLCVLEGISLASVASTHQAYWSSFYAAMKPAPGAIDLLKRLRANKVRIAILSDFQLEYQFEKLRRLEMLDLVDDVITSEEVGVEKPNSKMFLTALARLNARAERTVIIGDNFEKDILGAARCGIHGLWISGQGITGAPRNGLAFPDLLSLDTWLCGAIIAVDELVELSRYCGMRYDLTQAAGGNISVKFGSHMLIKSSGFHLADMEASQGYSLVDNQRLRIDLASGLSPSLDNYVQFSGKRPSIEAFMHAGLESYTVHLHPLQVNSVLTASDGRERMAVIWPDALIIDYVTPGLNLAAMVQPNNEPEQVIFLLSHGVIFSTRNFDAMILLIEKTLSRFHDLSDAVHIENYKKVNLIAAVLSRHICEECCVYLCEDLVVKERFKGLTDLRASFPDEVVYCGMAVLFMENIDEALMLQHIQTHGIPKLIVIDDCLYIADLNLKKCRDVEAVIKSVLLLQDPMHTREFLKESEVKFLNGWDSEKYRRLLKY